jgi:hypothetical protein
MSFSNFLRKWFGLNTNMNKPRKKPRSRKSASKKTKKRIGSRSRKKIKKGGGSKISPGEILRRGHNKSKTKKSKRKTTNQAKHPDSLKKYGYSLSKNIKEREKALVKATKHYGANEIIRKLNWVRVLMQGNPKMSKKYERDMKFVQNLKKLANMQKPNKPKKKQSVNRK